MEQKQHIVLNEAKIGLSPEGRFKKKLTNKVVHGLKCYEIIGGEITGIAFVNKPAHEYKAKVSSEKNRTITGVAIVPNKLIYRINPITGEQHYIFFTKKVIKELFEDYHNLINWSNDDRLKLVSLFSRGLKDSEIAMELAKDESCVTRRIKFEGEDFTKMVIMDMAQNKKSLGEISERLSIDENKLREIINSLGGTVEKRQ